MPEPVQFRAFLHALAITVDARNGREGRDALLREVGIRMAQLMPIAHVASVADLETEMNEILASIGWGEARMTLNEAERCLVIQYLGLPRIGSKGEPSGFWLGAALEGLVEGWMSQQPGANAALTARRLVDADDGGLELHYRRR